MKILHISRRFDPMPGGTERYVLELARAQVAEGHRVTVVGLDRDPIGQVLGRLPAHENADGIRVLRMPGVGRARGSLTFVPHQLIREIARADVVHLHDLRFMVTVVAAATWALHRPLIVHVHSLRFGVGSFYRVKRLVYRHYFGPLLSRRAEHVVVSGTSVVASIRDVMPGLVPLVRVIEPGTELEDLLSLKRTPERGRIVVLGRIDRDKGLDRLFDRLATTKVPWTLTIAGDGPKHLVDGYRAKADELGISERIDWCGSYRRQELAGILATAALAVFPSRYETFGLALLEAIAAGVPVVASDIPSHEEILEAGRWGFLADFDADHSSRLIEELLDSPNAQALAEVARDRAAQFSAPQMAAQIGAVYDDLARSNRWRTIHQRNLGSSSR